jgi:RIO-like serine/threonine protein kinase
MSENNIPQTDGEITIADLYPDLTPEQQSEAEYHLLRYLAVVRTIFEQIAKENPELLTELERRAMLRKIRGGSRDSSS